MSKTVFDNYDLYHYTSLNTLIAIIQNKTIRLTDYRFLNDTQEFIFGLDKVEKYAENRPEPFAKEIIKAIDNIKNGKAVLNIPAPVHFLDDPYKIAISPTICNINYYVISFSKKRDDLSLWDMYAKKGCCIKFNSQVILEFFHNYRDLHLCDGLSNITYGYTVYNDTPIKSSIDLLIKTKDILNIYDFLMRLCLLNKCKSFEHEQEFRIGLPVSKEKINKTEKMVYSVIDNTIKPQIEINGFPIEKAIEEIIISPFNSKNIVKEGIIDLLNCYGMDTNKVSFSNIKIR